MDVHFHLFGLGSQKLNAAFNLVYCHATTGYCHLVPSEINSLPVPVAFVVVANEPTGTLVVVLLAVIAVVKKYKPAVAFAAAAEPDVVMLVAVTAPKAEAPVTVRLSNDGSA
jgi:hypothetical protein